MGRKEVESPVEDAGASADAAATPVAPEGSQAPGDDSSGPTIVDEAVSAAEEAAEVVFHELSHLEQVAMAWVNDHFHGTPLSQATEALNYMRLHAVPDLLKRLREI